MKTKPTLLTLSLLWLSLTIHAQVLPGDVLYSTDFEGPNGSTPEDWVSVFGETPIMDINNNNYRLRRGTVAPDSGGSLRSAIYASEDVGTWSNYSVKTTFTTSTSSNRLGIIARWDGTFVEGSGSTANGTVVGGYLGYLTSEGTDRVLRIQSGFQKSASQGNSDNLASVVIPGGIADNGIYQLEFILEGPNLSLFLYDAIGNEIVSVTAVDSTWTTGGAGVSAYMGSNGRQVLFHDFEVIAAIPEAATLGLLGGVLLLGGVVIARRRHRA